ncbi:hypothetical protein ABZX92_42790 [Lentzea sp. NPDC006480]|uniref:hypothetical protein n=1 Tax=Lentzea sp. NPDC006480 TaxID=3157176 RepID=UPI00339EEA2A
MLNDLDMFDQLTARAIHASELRYYNCDGDLIWSEASWPDTWFRSFRFIGAICTESY